MSSDREKKLQYQRDWYYRNKEHHVKNVMARNTRVRAELRAVLTDGKDKPCADCSKRYPYYVMDYDHRPDEIKVSDVGAIVSKGSMRALLEEMAKCDVVCANCHRERTHQRSLGVTGSTRA